MALFAALAVVLPFAASGGTIQFVQGSTTPLIQLTGENFQISANGEYYATYTNSRTLSTSGLEGTDLGYPIVLPDKIVFLFGDSSGAYQSGNQYFQSATVGPYGADDSVAYIPNVDLTQCHYIGDVAQQMAQGVVNPNVGFGACPALRFYGNTTHPSNQHTYQAIQISGLLTGEAEGPFCTPSAGLVYNNRLYMFYITKYQAGNPHLALQSILAKSDQDPESWSDANPPTFTRLYTVSSHFPLPNPSNPPPQAGDTGEFMFNPPVVMSAATLAAAGLTQQLPAALQNAPSVVFVFGSSYQYNRSDLYLAAFSLSDIEAGTARWFYYQGNNQWTNSETAAAPLLGSGAPAGSIDIGNHSVVWNGALQRFILMRNNAGTILAQFSATPWGPWTAPFTVLSSNDTWGMKLIHHQGDQIVRSLITVYDASGNPVDPGDPLGIAYGPNLLDKSVQNPDGSVTVYYTLSTWNPYEVFLMSSTFTSSSTPVIGLVANAEGENPTIAPNTWVEIKGSSLAPPGDVRIWGNSDFVNNQMPEQLDGVSATVNGKSAYVYYISPTQLNILTPPDALRGPVQVQVTSGGISSPAFTAQAQAESPSFFVFGGGPYLAATHADGSLLGPAALYPGQTTPAKPGEIVSLYGNGFGPTSVPVISGSVMQSGSLPAPPAITIGGVPATVQYYGLVSAPGEFQFNVVVPASLSDGDQPITATFDGLTTQPGTLITIQH